MKKPIKVMQFICPTGFYGAERWILALAKHLDPKQVRCDLAVSSEPTNQDLELTRQYKQLDLQTHQIPMRGKFDLTALSKLANVLRDHSEIIPFTPIHPELPLLLHPSLLHAQPVPIGSLRRNNEPAGKHAGFE